MQPRQTKDGAGLGEAEKLGRVERSSLHGALGKSDVGWTTADPAQQRRIVSVSGRSREVEVAFERSLTEVAASRKRQVGPAAQMEAA